MNTTQALELVKLQMKIAVLNEMIHKANTQIESKGVPDSSQDLVHLGNILYEGLESINAISKMLILKDISPKHKYLAIDGGKLIESLGDQDNSIDPTNLLNNMNLLNTEDQ